MGEATKAPSGDIAKMSLFSVHTATDGSVVIYLEEPEANLDLLEDVVGQVPMLHLARLRDHSGTPSLKTDVAASMLDKVRAQVPETVLKIASMTEDEALDLAQSIIDAIKFVRAINGRTTKLEIVK